MFIHARSIATAAALISALAIPGIGLAATCPTSVIAYQASGTFGTNAVSGPDKLKLAGEPFSITLYACESKAPSQKGSDYYVYASIELIGTIKSALLITPYNVAPTPTTFILVQPSTGTDTVLVEGPLSILGSTITIKGVIALPAGTLTSEAIAPFPSVSIVAAKSGFMYSQGNASTTLSVFGTASATVYTAAATKNVVLHSSARVITTDAEGTQSVRSLKSSALDVRAPGSVMLQFYASGLRDATEVHAQIAGQEVPVRYFGAADQFPGLDEVTMELPRSLAGMGDVDVTLTVDGQQAEPVRIQIQ